MHFFLLVDNMHFFLDNLYFLVDDMHFLYTTLFFAYLRKTISDRKEICFGILDTMTIQPTSTSILWNVHYLVKYLIFQLY